MVCVRWIVSKTLSQKQHRNRLPERAATNVICPMRGAVHLHQNVRQLLHLVASRNPFLSATIRPARCLQDDGYNKPGRF